MDETVLGISFQQLRLSERAEPVPDIKELEFREDTHYIPVKILSKQGFSKNHPNGNIFN